MKGDAAEDTEGCCGRYWRSHWNSSVSEVAVKLTKFKEAFVEQIGRAHV